MLWALVPARLGAAVKTRLGTVLTPAQRTALARAMLSDVLAALRDVRSLAGVAVVTRDDEVAVLASEHGADTVRETHDGGLDDGVAQGVAALAARGATGVVIVMGDLPELRAAEIDQAIALLPARGLVLVPSLDGTGTNVLAMRPPGVLPRTHFGVDSLAKHRAEAARMGLEVITCPLRGAALDVDTVEDLARLVRSDDQGPATRRVTATLAQPAVPAHDA